MPRVVLAVGALSVLLIVWCAGGSFVVSFLDRLGTTREATLPSQPMVAETDALIIGMRRWPLHDVIRLVVDNAGRIATEGKTGAVTLGTVTQTRAWSDGASHDFTPEPGDQVTFERMRSRISWPTPTMAWSIMGPTRSWARYSYYRLRWQKACGASLELVWRDEQYRYKSGWSDAYLDQVPRSTIRPACTQPATR